MANASNGLELSETVDAAWGSRSGLHVIAKTRALTPGRREGMKASRAAFVGVTNRRPGIIPHRLDFDSAGGGHRRKLVSMRSEAIEDEAEPSAGVENHASTHGVGSDVRHRQ